MPSSTLFARMVAKLRKAGKTVTVVESSCGGSISAGILRIPGASSVFYGGELD